MLLSLLRGSVLPFDPPGLGSARLHAGMLPDALQTWLDGKLEQLEQQSHAGVSLLLRDTAKNAMAQSHML